MYKSTVKNAIECLMQTALFPIWLLDFIWESKVYISAPADMSCSQCFGEHFWEILLISWHQIFVFCLRCAKKQLSTIRKIYFFFTALFDFYMSIRPYMDSYWNKAAKYTGLYVDYQWSFSAVPCVTISASWHLSIPRGASLVRVTCVCVISSSSEVRMLPQIQFGILVMSVWIFEALPRRSPVNTIKTGSAPCQMLHYSHMRYSAVDPVCLKATLQTLYEWYVFHLQ